MKSILIILSFILLMLTAVYGLKQEQIQSELVNSNLPNYNCLDNCLDCIDEDIYY